MYTWPRDGLIPAASAVLESLWAYAWISFLLAAGESTSAIRYPFPWILGLLFLPAVAGRFLDRSYWGPKWLRQYGLTVLVVALFVGFMLPFHAAGAAWLAAGALLARGVWLALGNIGSDSAAAWFISGFAAFLALLAIGLVAHPASWDPDRPQLGPMLVIYLFAGLSLLALVRRQEMEERAFRRPSHELNGSWLILLATISAGMLGAVALVSFGGGGLARVILQIAAAVAAFIWRAAIFVVVNWLGPALLWLLSLLPFGGGGSSRLGALLGRRAPSDLDARLLAWLRAHLPIEVVLAIVGAMLMVLVAIWLAMRIVARDPGADEEERTSLWSWQGFLDQLARWLRGLRRVGRQSASSPVTAPASAPVLDSIRQLYAAALRRCRAAEHPRRPAETPLEFEPVIASEVGLELGHSLTAAYLQTRYAEVDVAEDRVKVLRLRWEERTSSSPTAAGEGEAPYP